MKIASPPDRAPSPAAAAPVAKRRCTWLRTPLFAAATAMAIGVSAHPHGPGNGGSAGDVQLDPDLHVEAVIARSGQEHPAQIDYVADLVRLALEAADVSHDVRIAEHTHADGRAPPALGQGEGHGANIAVASPAKNAADGLQPVYFPVQRGLAGQRLLVVRQEERARFAEIDSLSDLRERVGAVTASDQALFRHNRLETISASADGLLDAVANGQVDYAALRPQHAVKWLEQQAGQHPGLSSEGTPTVAYRGDDMLYVAAEAHDLIRALDVGLVRAYASGDLAEFQAEHPFLKRLAATLELNERGTIPVEHPAVPRALQRTPDDLWLPRLRPGNLEH